MIYAQASQAFTARLEDAPTGQAGTLGLLIRAPDDTIVLARTTAGIVETDPGVYRYHGTAPSTPGEYLVRWDTGATPLTPGDVYTEELQVFAGAPPLPVGPGDVRPDLTELGAILRARTRSDTAGSEIGTFDTTTRPTGAEAGAFVDHALAELELRLPTDLDDLTDRQTLFVRRLVAIRAAMMIELSYDPDRTDGQDSAYQRLSDQFDAGMSALEQALVEPAEQRGMVVMGLADPYGGDGLPDQPELPLP